MGFYGIWSLQAECRGLGRAVDMTVGNFGVSFPGDRYEETAEASTDELLSRPGAITRELAGRLVRGMNSPEADTVAEGPLGDPTNR